MLGNGWFVLQHVAELTNEEELEELSLKITVCHFIITIVIIIIIIITVIIYSCLSLCPDVRPEGGLPFCRPPHPGVQTNPEADGGPGPLVPPAGEDQVLPHRTLKVVSVILSRNINDPFL